MVPKIKMNSQPFDCYYESPGADKAATERLWEIPVADVQSNPRPSEELRLAYTAATFGEILRRSPMLHRSPLQI